MVNDRYGQSPSDQKLGFLTSWLNRSQITPYSSPLADYAQEVALFLRAKLKEMLDRLVYVEITSIDPQAVVDDLMRYEAGNEPLEGNSEIDAKRRELSEKKQELAKRWNMGEELHLHASTVPDAKVTGSLTSETTGGGWRLPSPLYMRSVFTGVITAIVLMVLAGLIWLLLQ